MGVVYKAEDTTLKRNVALKFLAPHLTQDPQAKQRFLREAQAAATVDHPNICAVHEIDEVGGQTFIAMAYVEGQTLDRKIQQGPLELGEAVGIASEVGLGLEAAHHKGIVHRDIKGANIMITEARPGVASQVKVMDFGLARLVDQRSLASRETALGTLSYAAPEQARGEAVDQRADIWSLGVVLYQMVSGRLPFKGETDAAVLYAILHKDPEPLTDVEDSVPIEIKNVIEKALAKEPDQRYQQVGELLEDLGSIREQQEVPGGARAPRKRAAKLKPLRTLPRRRRLAWAFGIAAAAVAVTMAGVAVRNFLPTTEAPLEPMRAVPLTSYPGMESAGSFSPDGNQVAFMWTGGNTESIDIYVKVVGPGPPLRLTTDLDEDLAPKGEPRRRTFTELTTNSPVFTPDGRDIVFSSGPPGEPSLWRVPVSGSASPERLPFGERGGAPAISRQGNLVYTTGEGNVNIWRVNLPMTDGMTGAAVKLIASSRWDFHPQYSPDGNRIAFVSHRSGDWEIWKCDSDGSNPVQLTSLGALATYPRWAPDGKSIGFNSDAEGPYHVYVVDAEGGAPRRLTSERSMDIYPTWSRNGKWIYFCSNRTGDVQYFRMPAAGGGPAQRVAAGCGISMESPDGSLFYFVSGWPNRSLWRVPVEGGEESQVLESLFGDIYDVVEDGVYFVPPSKGADYSLHFLRFATGAVEPIHDIEGMPAGLSVAPDGRSILYAQWEKLETDIMLVENFR